MANLSEQEFEQAGAIAEALIKAFKIGCQSADAAVGTNAACSAALAAVIVLMVETHFAVVLPDELKLGDPEVAADTFAQFAREAWLRHSARGEFERLKLGAMARLSQAPQAVRA